MRITAQRELIHTPAASSIHAYDQRRSIIPLSWHRHPECELTVLRSGTGTRSVGDGVEPFRVDEMVLIGPELPHSWSAGRGDYRVAVAQFPTALFDHPGAPPEMGGLSSLLAAASHGLVIDPRPDLAADLQALAGDAEPLSRFGRLCRLLSAFRSAAPRRLSLAAGVPDARRDRLGPVLAYIQAHAGGSLPLGRLAAIAGLTPPGLSRAFHRRLGTTLTAYIAEVRVGRVCRSLMESDAEITEVALAAGFAHLASCNRWFRRLRGTSPAAWRRAARAGR